MDNDRSMIEQHARNTRFVLSETISAGHQYLKITNVSIPIRCEGFSLESRETYDQRANQDPV